MIIKIENLSFKYEEKLIGRGISLELLKGETLGIVGESGCGKSSLLKTILDPLQFGITAVEGEIKFLGNDLLKLSKGSRRKLKGRAISLMIQNPYEVFNPIRSLKKQFKEALKSHGLWLGPATYTEIIRQLNRLGLEDGDRILKSCPYELSGGMNQRVALVLCIMLKPSLLLADEPTSALDLESQEQVIESLFHLIREEGMSLILVSHDISVVERLCDKTAIMLGGEIVEYGETGEVLDYPKHHYTKALIQAVPALKGGPLWIRKN